MFSSSTTVAALGAVALSASAAVASPTLTFRDTLANALPFIPGDGNTPDDFAIVRNTETAGPFTGNTIEMAVKAKQRWVGQDNVGGADNLYIVQAGLSPTSGAPAAPLDPDRAWWNFDFSVHYGTIRDIDNTLVTLTIQDIDGDSVSIPFFAAPPEVPNGLQLAQASWNTGFDFIRDPAALNGFDPFQLGDYVISLNAQDVASGENLGDVRIIVRVVPTPGAAGALGLAGLVCLGRRRR